MGNKTTRNTSTTSALGSSTVNQSLEDKYIHINNSVRIKSSNVSRDDMYQRVLSLQSMTYVTHSNRIITFTPSNFSGDSVTFEVSSEEAGSPLPNSSGLCPNRATFEVSSEEASSPLPQIENTRGNINTSTSLMESNEDESSYVRRTGEDRRDAENVVEASSIISISSNSSSDLQSDAELVVEEQSCPICFHTIPLNDNSETYITTQCNHTFCRSCLQKVFAHSKNADTCTIACPMCRTNIHRDIFYIEITPQTFVYNPNLSFIKNNSTRYMILEAYNVIHKHELWGKLRNLTPKEQEGFMFSKNPEIIQIMDLVNDKSTVGHSGASLAYTMRMIQQIARYGVDSLNTT